MTEVTTKTDTAKAEAPARARVEKEVSATLKRGDVYTVYFEGKLYRFKNGEVLTIPASLKAYLEETAMDEVTVTSGDEESETEVRPKFVFG